MPTKKKTRPASATAPLALKPADPGQLPSVVCIINTELPLVLRKNLGALLGDVIRDIEYPADTGESADTSMNFLRRQRSNDAIALLIGRGDYDDDECALADLLSDTMHARGPEYVAEQFARAHRNYSGEKSGID